MHMRTIYLLIEGHSERMRMRNIDTKKRIEFFPETRPQYVQYILTVLDLESYLHVSNDQVVDCPASPSL
jgi:hypothetical protein